MLELRDTFGPTQFAEELDEFLRQFLPADWSGIGALPSPERSEFLVRWREELVRRKLLVPSWPREYGGMGLGLLEQAQMQEAFARAGVPSLPHPNDQFAVTLIGPTLMHWGTDEQNAYFLPRMVSGEHVWAQGYSEPEAGSDLFGLRTTARLDGDQWVLDGQKTWQTAGENANWIFVLARTETTQGARGLSMLLVPTDQDGVEVRTIRSMTGEAEFAEFYFADARTDAANIVGPRGSGAQVALSLLTHERGSASGNLYPAFRTELSRLVELIKARGVDRDPLVRQRLAWCFSKVEVLGVLAMQNLADAVAGLPLGPRSSIIKLYESEYHAAATELAIDVLGTDVQIPSGGAGVADLGPDPLGSPNSSAAWGRQFLTARAATIYGGSSQIQRNTLGERVLGLPSEPKIERPVRG